MSNVPTEFIELRQKRDFSAVISTGFQFVRANWKTLYRPLLFIALPPYIVAAFLYGSFMRTIFAHTGSGAADASAMMGSMGAGILGYVMIFLSMLLMYALVFEYMRYYMVNKGTAPGMGELWREVRKQLLSYFAVGFLAALIAGVGMIFCLLPGIWLAIVFVVSLPLLAFERADVGDCIGRSFKLIKGHWWETFGLVVVLTVLIVMISYIIYLPFLLFTGFGAMSGIHGMEDPAALGSRMGWIMTVMMLLGGVMSVILQPLLQVSIGLHALSLMEEKEGVGLMQRVDEVSFDPKA